jgi:hypothetical protein
MTAQAQWQISLRSLAGVEGWNLFLLAYPGELPLTEQDRARLRRWAAAVLPQVMREFPGFHPFALAQYNQLNRGGAGRILGDHFGAWGVDAGLGYWPEREPPTFWTREEFLNLDIGEMPRPLMHQVFGINKGLPAIQEAFDLLLGLGPMVFTLSEDSPQKVKERATAQFKPLIQEPALRMFAWNYPLLCAATFEEKHAQRLNEWTCGIHFFLRESPEEKGIFIASKRPLDRVWRAAGATETEPGVWTWPAQPPEKAEKQE